MLMVKEKRSFSMYIVYLVCLYVLVGCTTAGKEITVPAPPTDPPKNILHVGVTPTAPPLVYYENNQVVGLEADFANALADSLGKKARFVIMGWNDLIPALLEKRIDIIMSGMSITRTREARIAFTSPYLKSGQMAMVRMPDLQFYPTIDSIMNTQSRVGYIEGSTGGFLVEEKFQLTNRKIPFHSAKSAIQALVEQRIDIFIDDAPVIWWKSATREAEGVAKIPIILTEERLAWGVRRDDARLLKAANLFLATWKEDGRLKRIIKTLA